MLKSRHLAGDAVACRFLAELSSELFRYREGWAELGWPGEIDLWKEAYRRDAGSRGVLQGYNGLAVVDDRAQIVVHAEAHGSGYEGHLLAPIIEATRKTLSAMEPGRDVFRRAKETADSGFHSKTVVDAVEQTGADVYIADRYYRQREPASATAARHKERVTKERALLRRKKREASTEASLGRAREPNATPRDPSGAP